MIHTLPQSLIDAAKSILLNESTDHPMIDVDGEMKHRHNSNGQPIHHTDDGIRNFHRWFGDSKAVDKHGRPLVVYHGTPNEFDEFDPSKIGSTSDKGYLGKGFYFSTSKNTAKTYQKDFDEEPRAFYLKLSKPKKSGFHTGEGYMNQSPFEYPHEDGAMYEHEDYDTGNVGSTEFVVASPSQIKSATGNNGYFSHPSKINESEEPDEVDQFRQKWEDAGVDNFVYAHEGRDTIGLSSVIVPKHAQNQGHGSKYMQDLSNLADKLGKTVILTPSSDFGGTKPRLVKFYKSHGFVENKGRNKDFTISETMYRRPQEYKGQAPHQPEPISAPTEKPLAPIKDTVMSKHMKNSQFHKWFEGSKVKSGMGDPVIVYHGSPDAGKIEESGSFHNRDSGIFFTNDLKTAKSYADERRSTNYQEAKGGVIPAHLNIKNPYYHDHQGKDWFGTEKVIADAKEKGHDGVIINNVVDHYNTNRVKKVRPSTVYVVFNPKQIKHATKNNGKHSPETENIFE